MLALALLLLTAGIQSRPADGMPVTQIPQTTFPPGCPQPGSCLYENKCYADGEEISRGRSLGWCYGMMCVHGGAMPWDDFNCGPTTAPTTAPTTPLGCVNNGVWYPQGSEVSRGSNDEGHEYGKICGDDGRLIAWDNWNREKSTTPATTTQPPQSSTEQPTSESTTPSQPTTPESTTTSPPTTPKGCIENGEFYPPGSEISQGSDGKGWCYGTVCDDDGQLLYWDDWNCGSTTTQSTPPPTPRPTPEPARPGCHHNGKWYPPGSDISKGSDGKGWCYGTFCTADGEVAAWDNWDCDPTTEDPSSESPSSTSAPTTSPAPPPTTVPIPLGCSKNGAWYDPGSEISRESDGEGWCHGIYCDANGKIVAWDDWNCETTDDLSQPTSEAKGCYYDNQWHPYGSTFEGTDSKGCKYGALCGTDGEVTRWDELDCQPGTD